MRIGGQANNLATIIVEAGNESLATAGGSGEEIVVWRRADILAPEPEPEPESQIAIVLTLSVELVGR